MKQYFGYVINKIAAWHELNQQRTGKELVDKQSNTDLVFGGAVLFFLYTTLVLGFMGVGGLGDEAGLIIVPIASMVWMFFLYKYVVKLFVGQSYKISRQMYDWRRKLHDMTVVIALTLEMFVSYLFISALIPGMTFSLKVSGYTFASSGIFMFIVGVVFIFVQPLVEGVLIRGYATKLSENIFGNTNKYLVFMTPVILGTMIHSINTLTLPVIFFALFQSVGYQLIAKKYGFLVSVQVNTLINVLMFSLL